MRDQTDKNGGETAKFLADVAHREDPSRKITAAFNAESGALGNKLADAVDVIGWNYRPHRYSLYRKATDWIFYGSETESCLSSRGIYYIPDKDAVSKYEKPSNMVELCDYPNRPWRRYDYVEIPVPPAPKLK